MKRFVFLLFLLFIISGCEDQPEAYIQWQAPTTGAPVDHYIVLLHRIKSEIQFETPTTNITLKLIKGETYTVRVAGVSANGTQGPFSERSDPIQIN